MQQTDIRDELRASAARFNRVVIWGLRNRWHTHRFIFQAYYHTLRKAGVPVIWVEDEPASAAALQPRDLVFAANTMYGKMVPEKKSLADYHLPVRDDLFYCLHQEREEYLKLFRAEQLVHLQFFTNAAERFPEERPGVHWDARTRTLYQPWGTDLLPHEFRKPTYNRHRFMFWVGSIWNDANNWGNIGAMERLRAALAGEGIRFVHVRFIPNFLNTFLIRLSRVAPAIAGQGQVAANYLPCRMFKNISYGQLGFSNVAKFKDLFGDSVMHDEDIGAIVKRVLALPREEYLAMIEEQQEICREYTIAHNLRNVLARF